MTKDQILSILFLIVCFISLYMSFFYIRKDRFLNTDDFDIFRDGILPPIVNFWIIKIFIVAASIFITYFGIGLIFREFK